MNLRIFALTGGFFGLLAGSPIQATTTDTTEPSSQVFTYNNRSNVTGSIAVIQAFNAIRDNNAGQLLTALNSSQNPINETFSIMSNGKEVKMRLTHAAVLSKSITSLSILLSRGARIAARDSLQKNAAHYAAFGAPDFGDVFDFKPFVDSEVASQMLELLQAEGLDVEAKDLNLRTPLHYAAIAGDSAVINRITGFVVGLDPKDIDGYTPTQLAIRAGSLTAIPNLLRRAGAMGAATALDYVVGTKNDITSFILVHPIATVGSLLVAGVGWMSRGLWWGAKKALSGGRQKMASGSSDDGAFPPFGIPQRSVMFGLGGGSGSEGAVMAALPLGSSAARSRSAPTSPTAGRLSGSAPSGSQIRFDAPDPKSLTGTKRAKSDSSAPSSASDSSSSASASAEAAASSKTDQTPPKTPAKQYQEATDAINTLRRTQDATRIGPALQEAERVLRDIRDQEVVEVRRHLLGAVGALAKTLPDGNHKTTANRISTDYAKKAKRH